MPIATGRALAAFLRYADEVPMNAPGVVCNGAALYDFAQGEYLETAMLDGDARRRGQTVLDRFPAVAMEAYHVDNVTMRSRPTTMSGMQMHITKVRVTETPSLLEVPPAPGQAPV